MNKFPINTSQCIYTGFVSENVIFSCDQAALWMVKSVCSSVTPFYPRPFFASGYCCCLRLYRRLSVTKFVRAMTHHPFKLESPNLDHRCKRPCLRCLLFLGWLTMTFKVKFNFAGLWTQAGNRRGGLATEGFAGPAGLVIICENYIGFYCWDLQLTCRTCNLNDFAVPRAGMIWPY